jgi:hypothetical protein
MHSKEDCKNRLWIEHVLPQTLPEKDWEAFDAKIHQQVVHKAGNQIPLTEQMNKNVAQLPYGDKKSKIKEMSKYKSARDFTKSEDWTPELLAKRTDHLKAWANKR